MNSIKSINKELEDNSCNNCSSCSCSYNELKEKKEQKAEVIIPNRVYLISLYNGNRIYSNGGTLVEAFNKIGGAIKSSIEIKTIGDLINVDQVVSITRDKYRREVIETNNFICYGEDYDEKYYYCLNKQSNEYVRLDLLIRN